MKLCTGSHRLRIRRARICASTLWLCNDCYVTLLGRFGRLPGRLEFDLEPSELLRRVP